MINPHLLVVMKFLKNPKSVSLEELKQNEKDARDAYSVASSVAYGPAQARDAYDAAESLITTRAAYYAASDAADAADSYSACVTYTRNTIDTIDDYFKFACGNKQAYLDHLENTNA